MIYIDFLSRLKTAFHGDTGGIDNEIDSAFSSKQSIGKPSVSERVLQSQQKFNTQFQSGKSVEVLSKNSNADFGRFDDDFTPDRHLDDFDETKNLEDFSKLKTPQMPPPLQRVIPENKEDLRELATATPRRGYDETGLSVASTQQRRNAVKVNSTDAERVIEELEDIRAQNGEILRRIQRIEEKLRKVV